MKAEEMFKELGFKKLKSRYNGYFTEEFSDDKTINYFKNEDDVSVIFYCLKVMMY